MREKTVSFAIFVKGFSSVIAQTLLARELLVIFYGNELTFGIILCLWLACGAAGSGWLGSLFKKSGDPLRPFCLFQFILSLWFPLAIILVRTSRGYLGLSFADIFGINHIVIITFISLSFIALSDGALFSIGFQLIPSVAKIYILESCGIIAGAILFTFIFLTRLDSFQIAFLVSGLNLLCCCLLLKSEKMRIVQWGPWIFLAASLCLFTQSAKLQEKTLAKQWQKKDIVINENSVYGNIAVSREADQFTIYYNGLLAANLPSPDAYFTEDFIHLPMLTQPHVQKVLFIGTAAGGLLTEALKYPLGKIVYVEMDPLFIKVLHALKDPATEKELSNPRVTIELTDGRSYIKKTPECFDVIFVNTGLATSLAINRYDTRDFFRETRRVLEKKGIAVFKTWGSLATLSPELAAVNASLYKTLKNVFPCVEVIPGDGFNIFIASGEKINLDPSFLDANWRNLKLETALINPVYIRLRLQESYRNWFYASLKNELNQASLNQDLRPTGLYEGLRLYYAQFSKKIPKFFLSFKKIRPEYLVAFLILFFCFWQLLLQGRILAASSTLKLAVAGTGFFAMSVQLIVLFLFQSFLGYLFQWLAILTMSFMVGASAGAFLAYGNPTGKPEIPVIPPDIVKQACPSSDIPLASAEAFGEAGPKRFFAILSWQARSILRWRDKKLKTFNCRKLGWMEIGVSLASGMFIFYEIAVFKNIINPALPTPWLFSAISICAGFLVGFEIPVAYSLLEREITLSRKESSGLAGKLYSLDLVGACIGALLTPLVLIPGCGIMATTLLLCFLKCATGLTLATIPKKNSSSSIAPSR